MGGVVGRDQGLQGPLSRESKTVAIRTQLPWEILCSNCSVLMEGQGCFRFSKIFLLKACHKGVGTASPLWDCYEQLADFPSLCQM